MTSTSTRRASPDLCDGVSRRRLLTAAGAVTLIRMTNPATAQSAKPIRLVVGFPPGGGIDFAARALQPALQTALGATVLVDYKPGAGGVLAATDLVHQPADGQTLLIANTGPFAIAPHLQAKRPYDPRKDFTYIGQISEGAYLIATRADHPANSLKAFVDWARANAGQVNFASAGNGTSTHLNGELLNQVAGLNMTHVPYKGSAPAVQDLIAGQTQVLIDAGTVLLPQIKGGKLKALAVTGRRRDPNLPDVPTAREQGFAGMESVGFQGLVAPPGLPRELQLRLSTALKQALQQPELAGKFATAGSELHYVDADGFAALVRAENDKWSTLITQRGIRID